MSITPPPHTGSKGKGITGGKLFYRIGEASRVTGVGPSILRYWESEFPVLQPRKGRGGQRVYQQRDIELILKIKKMLYEEGFTISGARRRLRISDGADPLSLLTKVKGELQDLRDRLARSEIEGQE